MDVSRKRLIGVVFVFLGAGFWGVGGTAADFLFSNENINVNWYVSTRLVISGLLLLAIQRFLKRKESIFAIWKNREMRWSLIIFSLVGMLLVQYSYMASIEMGNAAVATLLQYLAPVYIILWLLFRKQAKLTMGDVIAVFLTVVGTWLLLTNGSFQGLSVPVPAVVWGIVSGLSLAFYTLYATRLLARYSSLIVVGWAMLIAGICMNFIHPIWSVSVADWTMTTVLVLLFTIVFGTAIAFWFFIESLQYLHAKETTLIGTVEPLAAVISSIVWLNLAFGRFQVLGVVCIIGLVLYLSLQKKKRERE